MQSSVMDIKQVIYNTFKIDLCLFRDPMPAAMFFTALVEIVKQ